MNPARFVQPDDYSDGLSSEEVLHFEEEDELEEKLPFDNTIAVQLTHFHRNPQRFLLGCISLGGIDYELFGHGKNGIFAQDSERVYRPVYLGSNKEEVKEGLDALESRFFSDNPTAAFRYTLPEARNSLPSLETRTPLQYTLELTENDVGRLLKMNNIPSSEFLA